jgi:hypothetical protein
MAGLLGLILTASDAVATAQVVWQIGMPQAAEQELGHIPGNPPLPRLCISSIWRIIFLEPPPFIIRIIFCIC